MSPPRVRALLIGIDAYQGADGAADERFPTLLGPARDTARMERLLAGRFAVASDRIERLTATPGGDGRPPTYRNLVRAFEDLLAVSQPGEQVLVHFSGHGARVPTLLPELKGPAAYDECLVPSDIGCSEARYLRDLEIAVLLERFNEKGVFVTLILDCCHAGGATRGPARARGLAKRYTIERPGDSLLASRDELRRAFERATAHGKGMRPQKGWVPMPEGYVCFAACRASELAYEYPLDQGRYSGALSHWLLSTLEHGEGLSYRQVFTRVAQLVRGQFELQNPQLEGEADRCFLGLEVHGTERPGVPILQVDPSLGRLQIAAGIAQGLGDEARLIIEPGAIEARVVELDAVSCWAEICDGTLPGSDGECRARILEPGRGASLKIRTVADEALSEELRDAITTALAKPPRWLARWAAGDEAPDLLLSVVEEPELGEAFELLDAGGEALAYQEPRLPASSEGVSRLVGRLRHLARYFRIRNLHNPDPVSYLSEALTLELGRLNDGYRADRKPRPEPVREATAPITEVGQWLCLRIANTSSLVLHVAVLNLQPDWGIAQVLPTASSAPCLELEPDSENLLPLRAYLPASFARGRDILTVVAAVEPTDFRCLELPPLASAGPVRTGGSQPQNGLERYLSSLVSTPFRSTRDPHAGRDWITAQVAIEIRRSKENFIPP